jgi:hypothetical protein
MMPQGNSGACASYRRSLPCAKPNPAPFARQTGKSAVRRRADHAKFTNREDASEITEGVTLYLVRRGVLTAPQDLQLRSIHIPGPLRTADSIYKLSYRKMHSIPKPHQ